MNGGRLINQRSNLQEYPYPQWWSQHEAIMGVTRNSVWSAILMLLLQELIREQVLLLQVTRLLTTQSVSTIYKAQIKTVMEYCSLSWLTVSPITQSTLKSCTPRDLHSVNHCVMVVAVCTIYKLYSSSSTRQSNSIFQTHAFYNPDGQEL